MLAKVELNSKKNFVERACRPLGMCNAHLLMAINSPNDDLFIVE